MPLRSRAPRRFLSVFSTPAAPVLAALTLLTLAASSTPAMAAKKGKPQDLVLKEGFPSISEKDWALTEVPYAPGAPAAVLFEAEKNEWTDFTMLDMLRVNYWRRVKILTDDGVDDYGDFSYELYGDWRVKSVEARTLLPDRTEIDASDGVHQESSDDSGMQVIRIAFPKVQKGAILDLHITVTVDAYGVTPWMLQEDIPVLSSRFILIPPSGLRYRTALFGREQGSVKPRTIRLPGERKAFVWDFENLAALPREPNRPPREDISEKLVVILDSFRNDLVYVAIAPNWKEMGQARRDGFRDWRGSGHGASDALAREATEGLTDPLEKAEAIRRALRDRVRVDYFSDGHMRESPDEVLSKGSGTSADVAGLAASMLETVGVESTLAVLRRRGSGMIPSEVPIPSLLNDLILRIDTPSGPKWFSPGSDIRAGTLPWDCSGVLAMPLDGKSEKPFLLPDFASAENRTVRETKATLDETGSLEAEGTMTFHGVAAERWRRRLRRKNEDERRNLLERNLQRYMPGAVLASAEVENLDDAAVDLVVRCTWTAEGYATRAGKRVLVNPNLFARESTEDWGAAERKLAVHLGEAYEVSDTLVLELPEGAAGVSLPEPARMDAGPVGLYETRLRKAGKTVHVTRSMRLDRFVFPVQSFEGLKRWFGDIAANDDKPLVVNLP